MVGGLAASSAMLSPVVQTVLQMGFEAGLVESLVQTKYLLTGQHYTSVSDLVTDVLQAEQEDRQRGSQSRGEKGWCLKYKLTPKNFNVVIISSPSCKLESGRKFCNPQNFSQGNKVAAFSQLK